MNKATRRPSWKRRPFRRARVCALLLLSAATLNCRAQAPLPGTQPLSFESDFPAKMVQGIDRYLTRELERSIQNRRTNWNRDLSSAEAYEKSIRSNRDQLRKLIGSVEPRLVFGALEVLGNPEGKPLGDTADYTIQAVRWPVFKGVNGEGLWLQPKGKALARVVLVPDADQSPELLAGLVEGLPEERQAARRLAENRCEVLVPVLIDRHDTWSGNPEIRFTNQPHREWIYRQAFELGRHIIGYEVQRVLAAVDYFNAQTGSEGGAKIGVTGYGEGGLIAFYAAALDPRINASLVSGYFTAREQLWDEPIYRNVFGLLEMFGDAEIASLIAPRALIVEHSPMPRVTGPPPVRNERSGAAPGRIQTPDYEVLEKEFERAQDLLEGPQGLAKRFKLLTGAEGLTTGPWSDRALFAFLSSLGITNELKPVQEAVADALAGVDSDDRQSRQFGELEEYTQALFKNCDQARDAFFWKPMQSVSSTQEWHRACAPFRAVLWEDIIGKLPPPTLPANPRTRKILERERWTGYEVLLDVHPDVFAWGTLLLPKNLAPGEKRPVVVCQHGIEDTPASVVNENRSSREFATYQAFAARLADRGFVVFAPQNPYRGGNQFRQLQRKANPLGKSIFSFIIAQHSRILEWLAAQPFADGARIGLYGFSYGGKTAMRVPAVLEGYALSICSGDFNDWVRKVVSLDFEGSYMFTGEYEVAEWNLGSRFNHAEMAALIAPRPFMVERGRNDRTAPDEWVEPEYAKVKGVYDNLGITNRTEIEFFDGLHAIHGEGTFEFLHRHLAWPKPETE